MEAKDIAQIAQSIGVSLGVVVGGGWAWYRFLIQRASETSLAIELEISVTPSKASRTSHVFVATTLHNTGKRRLRASTQQLPARRGTHPGSADVPHALVLSIRRLRMEQDEVAWISWTSSGLETPKGLEPDMSLLTLFEETGQPFWLEPDEAMHLNESFQLNEGEYLARITFRGRRRGELWTRACRFSVPPASPVLT